MAKVEVQVTLKGDYEFAGGIVTATCGTARKSAHVGSTPPEVLAKIMLREMLEDAGADDAVRDKPDCDLMLASDHREA